MKQSQAPDKDAVYLARRAFAEVEKASSILDKDARLAILVDILGCSLETISAADLGTDFSILIAIFVHNHVWWTSITVMSMFAPYLVAYSATMKLLLRTKVFETHDMHGNINSWPRRMP